MNRCARCSDEPMKRCADEPIRYQINQAMLLVIDVGNTNTVLGVYQRPAGFKSGEDKMSLRAHWRVATIRTQTVDEYGVLLHNLLSMQHLDAAEVKGIIVSSV